MPPSRSTSTSASRSTSAQLEFAPVALESSSTSTSLSGSRPSVIQVHGGALAAADGEARAALPEHSAGADDERPNLSVNSLPGSDTGHEFVKFSPTLVVLVPTTPRRQSNGTTSEPTSLTGIHDDPPLDVQSNGSNSSRQPASNNSGARRVHARPPRGGTQHHHHAAAASDHFSATSNNSQRGSRVVSASSIFSPTTSMSLDGNFYDPPLVQAMGASMASGGSRCSSDIDTTPPLTGSRPTSGLRHGASDAEDDPNSNLFHSALNSVPIKFDVVVDTEQSTNQGSPYDLQPEDIRLIAAHFTFEVDRDDHCEECDQETLRAGWFFSAVTSSLLVKL